MHQYFLTANCFIQLAISSNARNVKRILEHATYTVSVLVIVAESERVKKGLPFLKTEELKNI